MQLLNALDKEVNVRLAPNKYIELILTQAMQQKSLMKRINASINAHFDRDAQIEHEFAGAKTHMRGCCDSCTYKGYPTQEDLWLHRNNCSVYKADHAARLERAMQSRLPQLEVKA